MSSFFLGPGMNPNDYPELAAMELVDGQAIEIGVPAPPVNSKIIATTSAALVPGSTSRVFTGDLEDNMFTTPMGGGGIDWGDIVDFGEDLIADLVTGGDSQPEPTSEPQIPNVGTLQVRSGNACAMYPGYHLRKNPKLPGKCVRNRKMNSLNPNALRRATRRIAGFYGHVKSTEKHVRQALSHALPHRPAARNRGSGCGYCGKSKRTCQCG